jgi:hypothetical protein
LEQLQDVCCGHYYQFHDGNPVRGDVSGFSPRQPRILPQHPQRPPAANEGKAESVADHPHRFRNTGKTRR